MKHLRFIQKSVIEMSTTHHEVKDAIKEAITIADIHDVEIDLHIDGYTLCVDKKSNPYTKLISYNHWLSTKNSKPKTQNSNHGH